jgi:predicted O-linked N-acetylglucosamine transferase (SPINDLY family)
MNSESPMVNFNRGMVLLRLHRLEEALVSFERTIQISPNFAWARGQYLNTLSRVCDWSFYAKHLVSLVEQIQKGERACRPFTTLSIFDGPKLQKNAAEIYIQAKHPLQAMPAFAKEPHRSSKIRLGYYSPDFCNHAVSCLIVELLELHDKNKFELIAFSFGPNTQDDMRQRVASAFDQFIDVRFKSDKEIALLSREMGIDIAIDLAGFTQDARTRIFAYRCAPIQVNYLGFPGTMGAEYIDYLIADETLIPDSSLSGYSEKIIKMPYSFQANDRQKVISDRVFSRQELGLPAKGFVFCCFNNNYKITPEIFDVWMRVLQKVPGSVLWLLADNPTAQANLTKEAIHRGVEAGRLIFAQRLALPEYLARYRAADLFLDTVPFNAGTTASDALWAGLPVLTLMGESFAGRMAASLLNAIEMPELIEQTIDGYESRAIELATKPKQMAAIRAKLAANRLTTPLFNTPLFTRHLEQAYTQMHERYLKGLPPDHISRVAPTKAP